MSRRGRVTDKVDVSSIADLEDEELPDFDEDDTDMVSNSRVDKSFTADDDEDQDEEMGVGMPLFGYQSEDDTKKKGKSRRQQDSDSDKQDSDEDQDEDEGPVKKGDGERNEPNDEDLEQHRRMMRSRGLSSSCQCGFCKRVNGAKDSSFVLHALIVLFCLLSLFFLAFLLLDVSAPRLLLLLFSTSLFCFSCNPVSS